MVNIDAGAFQHPRPIPIPHELPPAAEEFFGRQAELDRLTQRLRARKNIAVVGFAGMGKTALAAKALAAVVGDTLQSLAASPYPDGVVFLDLYTLRGAAEPAWETLANELTGPNFLERSPARERATNACQGRNILVVIEGGEEANGLDGHARIDEILEVLSQQNRWLLLTRLSTQAPASASVTLTDALQADEAGELFDSLTRSHVPPIPQTMRDEALKLLEGHPLALTWAGNLLARGDESPTLLVGDWKRDKLPSLSDPSVAEHTWEWLFMQRGLARHNGAPRARCRRSPRARSVFHRGNRSRPHRSRRRRSSRKRCCPPRSISARLGSKQPARADGR